MTRRMREIQEKGFEVVRVSHPTSPFTRITAPEPFCVVWESGNMAGTLTPSQDRPDGRHWISFAGIVEDETEIAFDVLTDARVRERKLTVPPRTSPSYSEDRPVEAKERPAGSVLFEDINFTVVDRGSLGVAITFVGKDVGEEVSGTKWFVDDAAMQVREICDRVTTALPDRLAKLTGIDREWQTLDIGHTKWSREGADFMVFATRIKADDGADEWWLQTRDDNGIPFGPQATGEVYDVEGVRIEGRRLANHPSSVTAPGR